MNVLQAVVLGITQGLTEFLPISSSAHLVLIPHFLNWKMPPVTFDAMLHFGTLVAVILYFRADVKRLIKAPFSSLRKGNLNYDPYQRLFWLIIIGTLPATFTAILFKDFFERLFSKPLYVAYFLLITGLLLIIGEVIYRRYGKRKSLEKIGLLDSIIIGCFQAAAIAPGISRSGITIVSGLFRGITRDEAAKFSFLLAIPIILGATFDAMVELIKVPVINFNLALIAGFLTALISGHLAIKYLLRYLKRGKLYIFAYYCWVVGVVTLFFT